MKKRIALYVLATVALFAAPALIRAQDIADAKPDATAPAADTGKHGKMVTGAITALDTNAMTITVSEKTFSVNSDTKITKGKNPIQLSDLNVGDNVKIAFKKDGDSLVAKSISIGGKGKGKKKQGSE